MPHRIDCGAAQHLGCGSQWHDVAAVAMECERVQGTTALTFTKKLQAIPGLEYCASVVSMHGACHGSMSWELGSMTTGTFQHPDEATTDDQHILPGPVATLHTAGSESSAWSWAVGRSAYIAHTRVPPQLCLLAGPGPGHVPAGALRGGAPRRAARAAGRLLLRQRRHPACHGL